MIEIIAALIFTGIAGYMVFAIVKRGFKGAMFGQKILSTCEEEVVFHRAGVKHTYRLHQLEQAGMYGLEIGRWTGPLGETTMIVKLCRKPPSDRLTYNKLVHNLFHVILTSGGNDVVCWFRCACQAYYDLRT